MSELAQRLAQLSPAQRQLLESRLKQSPTVAQPIAIVGMACRLPGAPDLESYWRLICEQRHAFQEIPEDRWAVNDFYDPDPDAPGKMATRRCAFVDRVADFDAVFFGIAPREASRMDPQQRLLLEVSWEALEHAGIAPERLAGTATGVFVGIGGTDYSKVPSQFDNYLEVIDAHVGTGNALSIASNRVSYILDLRGPSLSVDTACSSGLLGVHLAIQSLRQGECDAALAGGVNLILSPEVTIAFSKARMLSPTGHCRPFDSRADGYVRGEGCAMLVLKRLTDAIRDGDRVLAVLRGSAANQDGRTSGITAPNSLSQQACIRSALASAGLESSAISYVEAHGTGTPLGDPIELQSLARIFKLNGANEATCHVASVKANIGHTETVSGVAGIVKVVLMMQHGIIPAQAGLEAINENIRLDGTRLQFPRENVSWGTGGQPRVAGVSSFGFGGTNTHVIVESATSTESLAAAPQAADRSRHLLAFSAKSKAAVGAIAERYLAALDHITDEELPSFCHTANVGRSHFNQRCAIVTQSRDELRKQFQAAAGEEKTAGVKRGEVRLASRPKLAFLFTGQGSQYSRMAAGLYERHPLFRQILDQCEEILRLHRTVALTEVLFGSSQPQLVNETEYTQPALFAVEYALARLWQSWGVEPAILLGHSVGEYVAACIAEVFSCEDGLRLIAKRAELMQRMPPNGTMAVIFANRERVHDALKDYAGRVVVATANGPENNVISGETSAVEEVVAQFAKAGVPTQKLTVSHAFHSPLMDPMLDEFERFAATIRYAAPRIPIVANRTGEIVEAEAFDAAYWRDHLRNSVEFAKGMERLAAYGVDAYLEVGPAPVLIGMGRKCVDAKDALWISSLRKSRDDWETLLTAVQELYVLGQQINWVAFDAPWKRSRLSLPTYPFKRSYFWMEGERSRFGGARGTSVHPLLGSPVLSSLPSRIYESRIGVESPKLLKDHVVQGTVTVPGAAYVEQGLALARLQLGPGAHAVEDLAIQRGLFLPVEGYRLMQTVVAPEAGGRTTFDTHSTSPDSNTTSPSWLHHVAGTIVHEDAASSVALDDRPTREQFAARAVRHESSDEFYELMRMRNLTYGPVFRVVKGIARTSDEALAEIEIPESVRSELGQYVLHPAIGDGIVQTTAGVVPFEENGDYTSYTYVPMRFGSVRVLGPVEKITSVYARRISTDSRPGPESVVANAYALDDAGELIVAMEGIVLVRTGKAIQTEVAEISDWMYAIRWQPQPRVTGPTEGNFAGQHVVILADDGGVAAELGQQLEAAGAKVTLVRPAGQCVTEGASMTVRPGHLEDFQETLRVATSARGAVTAILHLWSLDTPAADSPQAIDLAAGRDRCLTSSLYLTQAAALSGLRSLRIVWVTSQAQSVANAQEPVSIVPAAVWGFGRVAAVEHPELAVRLLDLDRQGSRDAAEAIRHELVGDGDENQIAYRQGQRYVARLVRCGDAPANDDHDVLSIPSEGEYRLRLVNAGSLDGLRFERMNAANPGPGQVALRIEATGLNFSDVLKAMGLYPGIRDAVVPLGIECAGVVTAVGPNVTRFQVGDEVLGVAPYSFASQAITTDYALVKKPSQLSFQDAATVPIVFLTAYYALVRLAQIQPGERLLIQAAAGGVGLAAIQIAQHLGAEVFATAGSDEKRDYLRGLGVRHVYSSRTLEFSEEILRATNREGVDIVLNSLPGDAIAKSLSILRAYGRFLEIGKTDIYSNTMIGLLPFQDNLSYFAIDLDRMLRQRPEFIRDLFEELMGHFEQGHFRPIPATLFPASDTIAAFRYMAQRKNIGKVIVSMADRGTPRAEKALIRPDATYLITGGLGALGLHLADWLASHGARHVALLSRRDPSDAAKTRIASLRDRGVQVAVCAGDVTRKDSLGLALSGLPSGYPPIRGVMHAAGALADGVILKMTAEQLDVPLASKYFGSWNLHECFPGQSLDWFVGFSSIASVLGSPGQANYAAGNAFLDALAAFRRSQGEPGLSVNWGPWAESGMAAEAGREKLLAGRGMSLLPPARALESLEVLLRRGDVQTAVMSVNWNDLLAAGGGTVPPLLREVASGITHPQGEESSEDLALRTKLQAMPLADRGVALEDYFTKQLSAITGLEAADIDRIRPLNTMGLDSLMAIELKNKVEKRLRITIPMTAFMHEPSVASLSRHAAESFDAETTSGTATSGMTQTIHDPGGNGSADGSGSKVAAPKFIRSPAASRTEAE